MLSRLISLFVVVGLVGTSDGLHTAHGGDYLRELQTQAITEGVSPAGHWGADASRYSSWTSHSNRLIPVYTYGTRGAGAGIDLDSYIGANSPYRSEAALRRIYGYLPDNTLSPAVEYLDQTNVFDLQLAAFAAGRKHIFLVVFDGMDWETIRAAATFNLQRVAYDEGRGTGTHFQDYTAGGTSQFGWMVTSPHNDGTTVNVDTQQVLNPGGTLRGGYDPRRGGATPWTLPTDELYLIAQPKDDAPRHAYTDSSSSATSMTTGAKTYNDAVNVDPSGHPLAAIAHRAQRDGYAVGAVSSVPISHATPAAAYAHNVHRDDYQDLSRDMLGLPSISHSAQPLPGMDVVIGTGHGVDDADGKNQGSNFVPGNRYVTANDLRRIDVHAGGRYVVAERTPGVSGAKRLHEAALQAAATGRRLFGFFGVGGTSGILSGHLPYATADGDFQPAPGVKGGPLEYTPGDLLENPTLADMTAAALTVLEQNPQGFWLLVEPGDVDWANHDNNLDTSIGAVNSGDAAVKTITDWVERHSNWNESLLIVTADHGHYLVVDRPELLVPRGP